MAETADALKTLGSLGLLERLNPADLNSGLSEYKLLIEAVRHKNYPRVQGIGDDFIPDTDLYNAVGAIYPLLRREQKDEAIRAHLAQFDGVNYFRVNTNHTPNIRDPQLLTDITIARYLYWPGLHDEERLWKDKKSFAELQKSIMCEDGLFDHHEVNSDFLVAYALMRKDFTKFGDDYVKAANPHFLDRVLKGIVALRFNFCKTEDEINKGRNRLYELLPKAVHDRIEPLRQEADWCNSALFQ